MAHNDYYSANFENQTFSNPLCFWINCGTTNGIELVYVLLTQDSETANAMETISIVTIDTPGGGTGLTEVKLKPGAPNAVSTAFRSEDGNHTLTGTLVSASFNVLNGWLFQPPKDARPQFNSDDKVGLKFSSGFDTSITWTLTVIWREI